ncbi:E3 ubiquitin-protein ligase dtx3l [Mactra antiquata]
MCDIDEEESDGEIFIHLFEEKEEEPSSVLEDSFNPLTTFSDDLFTELTEENLYPLSSVGNDSTSSSELKFGLFDDSNDEECDDYNASDNEIKYDNNETVNSRDDAKTKVEVKSSLELGTCIPVGDGRAMNRITSERMLSGTNLPAWTGPTPDDDNFCCICMDEQTNSKTLHKCSHSFCTDCIDTAFNNKPECPVCFVAYGIITGNQPAGYMSDSISKIKLPGYESTNTIVVYYRFPDGTQTADHPNPGAQYYGTNRTAYLPNNAEGQKVLRLLKESFQRKLTFTVGRSRTTGCDNVVTWNDIHHKTCTHGGQENFGYPDPTYLSRVQEELAAKGVTVESLNNSS